MVNKKNFLTLINLYYKNYIVSKYLVIGICLFTCSLLLFSRKKNNLTLCVFCPFPLNCFDEKKIDRGWTGCKTGKGNRSWRNSGKRKGRNSGNRKWPKKFGKRKRKWRSSGKRIAIRCWRNLKWFWCEYIVFEQRKVLVLGILVNKFCCDMWLLTLFSNAMKSKYQVGNYLS